MLLGSFGRLSFFGAYDYPLWSLRALGGPMGPHGGSPNPSATGPPPPVQPPAAPPAGFPDGFSAGELRFSQIVLSLKYSDEHRVYSFEKPGSLVLLGYVIAGEAV